MTVGNSPQLYVMDRRMGWIQSQWESFGKDNDLTNLSEKEV
jgi:hypothetical protein